MRTRYWLGAWVLAGTLGAAPAAAAIVEEFQVGSATTVGTSFDLRFEGLLEDASYEGNTYDVTLSADLKITLKSFSTNLIELEATIKNTTSGVPALPSDAIVGVKSFGMDSDPDLPSTTEVSLDPAGDYFKGVALETTMPNYGTQGNRIDICMFTPNSCQGGSVQQSLLIDDQDTFTLVLSSGTGTFGDPIKFSNFAARFYGDFGSWLVRTEPPGDDPPEPPQQIPEPAPIALLGIGLLSLVWVRRRFLS
jgi:hypothetical protein